MARIQDISRRVGATGIVLSAVALLASACGGGTPTGVATVGSTAPPRTTTANATGGVATPARVYAELVKFASCMRSQGIENFPDPTTSSGGVSLKITPASGVAVGSARFAHAQAACAKDQPARPGAGPPITPAQQADYLKAATCMRAHGIVGFPDPTFSGSDVKFPLPSTMNPNAPQFLRAREICELLIPAGLPFSKQAEGGK